MLDGERHMVDASGRGTWHIIIQWWMARVVGIWLTRWLSNVEEKFPPMGVTHFGG